MFSEPTHPRCLSRPGEPTDAAPGSEKKIHIMIERASRREPLFHPQDGLGFERVEAAPAATPWWHLELTEEVAELADDAPLVEFTEAAPNMVAQPA